MDDSIKKIFRWGVFGALLIISLVPNGTQFIPMFFSFLGALGAFFSGKQDVEDGKNSGRLKILLAGILFLIFLFFTFRRFTDWRSILG